MLYQNMDREKVREFGSLSGLSVKTPRYSEARDDLHSGELHESSAIDESIKLRRLCLLDGHGVSARKTSAICLKPCAG